MRLRANAITSAPIAPIAPPSVGVAMPRKIVPSTRKISTSGGINTKVTRSASLDSRPSLKAWFASARNSATKDATVIDRISTSSPGASLVRSSQPFSSGLWKRDQTQPAAPATSSSASSDLWPLAPLSSR